MSEGMLCEHRMNLFFVVDCLLQRSAKPDCEEVVKDLVRVAVAGARQLIQVCGVWGEGRGGWRGTLCRARVCVGGEMVEGMAVAMAGIQVGRGGTPGHICVCVCVCTGRRADGLCIRDAPPPPPPRASPTLCTGDALNLCSPPPHTQGSVSDEAHLHKVRRILEIWVRRGILEESSMALAWEAFADEEKRVLGPRAPGAGPLAAGGGEPPRGFGSNVDLAKMAVAPPGGEVAAGAGGHPGGHPGGPASWRVDARGPHKVILPLPPWAMQSPGSGRPGSSDLGEIRSQNLFGPLRADTVVLDMYGRWVRGMSGGVGQPQPVWAADCCLPACVYYTLIPACLWMLYPHTCLPVDAIPCMHASLCVCLC